jgi:chromosome segregation ATPase
MIACVSPAEYNLIETVNTLMYANRARNIRNRLEKNEFEEWQTNDNAEFLRGVIGKLKAELRAVKTASIASSTVSKDMTASSLSLASDGHSSPSTIPDMDQIFLDQRNEIMNLQHLIEKLEGDLAVTREREQVAEQQLKQMWKNDLGGPRPEDIEKLKQEVDFEHLVEPVIEEYEKSISVLESQLAMARAALHHSDIGFEEQSARITHQEQVNESQSHIINELRARISKVTEREQSNDLYIQELESKLSKASQESIREQESLNDLKSKLAKLSETEDSTEQYITSLEHRLANVEKEKDVLADNVQALEISNAAKDTTAQALKSRLEQAERGDDKKMMLHELDDALQRYQELEVEHGTLRSKYEALANNNTTNVDQNQQFDENGQNQNTEQVSAAMDKSQKRHSRSFQEEINAHKQATDVVEKEKEIVSLNARILVLQKDLTVLESQSQETQKKLDITAKAHEDATSQIEKLEKIVQEHMTKAEEENIMSSEPEDEIVPVVGLHEEMERELVSSKQREQLLQHQLENARQELHLTSGKLTVYDNERSQLQHAMQDLQRKLEVAEAEVQEANVHQQDLVYNFDAERALTQKSASHLESEIELLKLERADLQAQLAAIQTDTSKREAQIAVEEAEATRKVANGHVDNHVELDTQELQEELAEQEKRLSQLNETVVTLQDRLSESASTTQLLSEKVIDLTAVQEEAAKTSQSFSELKVKYAQLQQELNAYKEKVIGSQELSSSLQKQLDISLAERKVLSQQLADLDKTALQPTDSYDREAEYLQIRDKLKATEEQLETSNRSILSLQSELGESVVSSAALIERFSDSTKAQSRSAEDIENKYQLLQAQLSESETSHRLARESIQHLQTQLDESMAANAKLTDQLSELTSAHAQPSVNDSFEKERLDMQHKVEASEANLAELNIRLQALQKQHDESISAHIKSSEIHATEKSELQQTLEASENELAGLDQRIQGLQKQHGESIAALDAANAKIAEYLSTQNLGESETKSSDVYQKERLELQQKLETSEDKLAKLDERLQTVQKQHVESIALLGAANAKLVEQSSEHTAEQSNLNDIYEKERSAMQLKLEASETQLAELNKSMQTLRDQQIESAAALDAANAQLTQRTSEHTSAQSHSHNLFEKQLSELQLNLEERDVTLRELNQQLQTLEKQHKESVSALEIANDKLLAVSNQQPSNDISEAEHRRVLDNLKLHELQLATSTEQQASLQKELDELKVSHHPINQQLSELTSTLTATAALVESLQSALDDNSTAASESDARAQQLQSEIERGVASLKVLSGKHDGVLQQLSELEKQYLELQQKHDLVAAEGQSNLETAKLETQSLQSSIDDMVKIMEQLASDKDTLESKLQSEEKLTQTLQSTIVELEGTVHAMRTAKDSAEQKLEIQKKQTSQVQSALEKQLAITSGLETSINEMNSKLQQIEVEAAEAAGIAQSTHQREREEEVELYQNAIMELETKLQSVYTENTKSQKTAAARHNDAELQLTKVKEEIVERDMFIVELETSVDKMESELMAAAEKLQQKSDAYLQLQQVASEHESEIARLGKELDIAKQKFTGSESEKLQKLNMQIKSLQEETEEYNLLIEQMDTDIQNKSAEMEEIIAELAAAESAKVQSQALVKELEQELLEVRNNSKEPTSEETKVDNGDQDTAAKLADANSQLKKLQQEKIALTSQMEQMTVDNSQLQTKISAVERKLETQSLKMSKEAEDLRQQIGKLLAKNELLEKETDVQQPQVNKRSSRNFAATRDSTSSIMSPPQTPRITSPSPDTLQNKLKLHENTISQQASLIKSLEDKVQQSVSISRASLEVNGSAPATDKHAIRKSNSSPYLPPPPSEPLPPLPTAPGHTKSTSVSSLKSNNLPDESQQSETAEKIEQFEKTVRSLQKKLGAAETDVKAHLEVITKLEQQLFRAENALKETRKRTAFSPTRASTSDDSELDNLKKQLEQASAQLSSQQEKSAKDLKKLQDDLDAERKAKEKAEKARVILENRIDQLMSKKSKFMCF